MLVIVENYWQDAYFDVFQEGLFFFIAVLIDYKIYLLTIRSNMDVLTGLSGRRVFDEFFDYQLRNVEFLNFYLMLLDIDRFKLVNDIYGYLIGDVVLRILVIYLVSWTRDYETVYRYGGEEFIIIVKAVNDEEVCRVGVRICQLVDNYVIIYFEGYINIIVIVGVSRVFFEEFLDVVIGRADRVMYEGK